ncbi:MAG: GCN5 family acetyltransferase [Verrucomicrobia bacterium]|nr:GCN5 family acetyltransferase [Verrucomicrobiota bacterium]
MREDAYPKAVDPSKVGSYPALANAGAGYFFDEVLEYRVWCHPELGAPKVSGNDDYFHSFATYSDAFAFHKATRGSEEPLVLVRQLEHVNEPKPGKYVHVKGERIAEWQCEWLKRGPRQPGQIEAMIKKSK